MKRRTRMIANTAAILFGCVLVAIAGTETLIRLTTTDQLSWASTAYEVQKGYVSFRPHATLEFENERARKIAISVDDRGFRNSPGSFAKANILLLGDSFAAAVNTPQELTVAGRLNKARYEIYNAGADGSGTFHQLAIMEDALAERTFKDVVLLFYTGNDFHDNFMTFDSVVDRVRRRLDSMGNRSGSNERTRNSGTAPDFGAAGARPWWRQQIMNACDRLRLCLQIYNNFWLGQIRGYARNPWTNRRYMQMHMMTDAKHPEIDKALANTRLALAAMKALATAKACRLTIVAVPARSEVMGSWYDPVVSASIDQQTLLQVTSTTQADFDRPERSIRQLAADLEIGYHALLPDMRKQDKPASQYGVIDGHWIADGQAVAFRSLDGYFRSIGIGGKR